MLDFGPMSRERYSRPLLGRSAAVAVATWLSLGCSQALGLEGLTFEEPTSDDAAGPSTSQQDAGLDAEDSASDPDSGPPSLVNVNTYPRALAADGILVGNPDPRQSSYFLYSPVSGETSKHVVDIIGNRYEAGEIWSWVAGFSLLTEVPGQDGSVLVGYDAESGIAEHLFLDDQGTSTGESERVAGSAGWTHLVPFVTGGTWQSIAYSDASGNFRYGPTLVDDAASGEVVTGTWGTNWTALAPVPIGSEVGVLRYDAVTGDLEVEQLTGDADDLGDLWTGSMEAGYAQLLTFATNEGLLLLTYEAELGQVTTWWMTLADEFLVESHEGKAWRSGLSQILPLWNGLDPHALTYSAETGVAELRTVLPLESPPAQVK